MQNSDSAAVEPQPAEPSSPLPPLALGHPQKPAGGPAKKALWVLLAAVLLCLGSAAGYWYGHKSKAKSAISSATVSSPSTTNSSGGVVHFVKSVGYPYDATASKYQYETNLGVPDFMQAVRVSSDIPNQGTAYQMFTDGILNNELGRWELGNPADSSDNGGGTSEISLIAATNSWLNATGKTDFSMYTFTDGATFDGISQTPLETSAQKQQFMSELVAQTASCVKDPSKGFQTKDGNLDVCYVYLYGREGYSPEVILLGYGKVQNQPLILTGQINIYDTSVGSSQSAQQQAIGDAKNGHPTATTAQAQTAIIAALKQTTVTAIINPNIH